MNLLRPARIVPWVGRESSKSRRRRALSEDPGSLDSDPMEQSRPDAEQSRPDVAPARPGSPTQSGSLQSGPIRAVELLRLIQHGLFASVVLVAFVKGLQGSNAVATSAASAALVLWYLTGLRLERTRRTVPIAAAWLAVLTALCIGAIFVSADFAWVSFAVFVLFASVLPSRVAYGAIVVLAVCVGAVLAWHWPTDRHWAAQFVGPLMGAAAAAGLVSVYRMAARESRERQVLIDELLRTQDDLARAHLDAGARRERERVAAEIHDTLAQSFASTMFLGRQALRELDSEDSASARQTLGEIVRTGSLGLEDARRLVRGLPPHELNDNGLADALGVLVVDDSESVQLRVDGEPRALPQPIETALLRVAQEALSNAREHSCADRIVITLTYGADEVGLDVVDDGRGFAITASKPGRDGSRGFGTTVMAKRIGDIGGTFTIESSQGAGTAVSAIVPLDDSSEADT